MLTDDRDRIKQELESLAGELEARGHQALSEKAAALADKSRSRAMYVAFCGHFSAGKSSLINHLCGARLLPSSPIPTSANIVAIRNAEETCAVLTYRDGREERVPLEDVSKFAKDGEAVRSVELLHPIPMLGAHGVLLDTPGVDSTDDNHREATESALHLADVVCYVMDYNHVLSEMNMDFAKRLSEMGKPLILVVNQIDKHREEEVPFAVFQAGVADAFRSWGVEPAACLYTTLKEPDHRFNEAERLRGLLQRLVVDGDEITIVGLASAAIEIVEEEQRLLRSRNEERRAELERQAALEDAGAAARYDEIQGMIAAQDNIRNTLVDQLRAEAGAIAENANIMPATTRDAAHSFLESRQPGFRVGLLFAGAKTEEERKRRLDKFYHELTEHVDARLVWHVRDAVKKAGLALSLSDADIDAAAETVQAELTPDWLLGKVRSGAVVSGEYTLNYTAEVAGEVRLAVKRAAAAAAEKLADAAEAVYAAERPALLDEAARLEAKLSHRRELEALVREELAAKERLLALLPAGQELARRRAPFPDVAAIPNGTGGGTAGAGKAAVVHAPEHGLNLSKAYEAAGNGGNSPAAIGGTAATEDLPARLQAASNILDEAARLASTLPSLDSAAASLRSKAGGLREQRFTAALFGAFSAGKSSFANALLGDGALPVSPNPTTAAINTVVPPTAEFPHGTARVTMKTKEAMLEGIRYSLESLGEQLPDGPADEAKLLKRIQSIGESLQHVPPGGKPHLAFLRAVASGWGEAAPMLGTDVRADRELFRAFVAEERKSAFVERIELHYDSPLSRQGVTLVDTPGADSINARHTGVAFNYMKNADAIFFVTYYNHAFSRADRQFLEQLGRVKDAFELDKMFFIVNAADLAASEEELQDVLAHVRTNLAAFGVRHPRLFPVSSLRALEAKRTGSAAAIAGSGIAAFEEQFAAFAGGELAGLAYRSAEAELRRTVNLAATLLQGAKAGEEERLRALEQLEGSWQKAREWLRSADLESVRKDVLREASEQLYYVKQRFMHRFGEWYAASFNPSALREDRGDMKQQLVWAWRDLTGYIQTELVNEALAATLRVERFMNRSLKETVIRWNESLRRELAQYEPETWEELTFETPDIDAVWAGDAPDIKLLTSHYRSSKAFFEGGGRKALREALERRWQQPIADAIDQLNDRFASWVDAELAQARTTAVDALLDALEQSVQSARAAWEQPLDSDEIERILARMRLLAADFEASSRSASPVNTSV